jgi:hypothetical protein
MAHVSQGQTLRGVGRLHCGRRNLGCVGYLLQDVPDHSMVVRFDPMPDTTQGEVLHLTLEDGRILECQVLDISPTCCAVLDGPRVERRQHRRRAPVVRAYL